MIILNYLRTILCILGLMTNGVNTVRSADRSSASSVTIFLNHIASVQAEVNFKTDVSNHIFQYYRDFVVSCPVYILIPRITRERKIMRKQIYLLCSNIARLFSTSFSTARNAWKLKKIYLSLYVCASIQSIHYSGVVLLTIDYK